jgi:hypothetical protein
MSLVSLVDQNLMGSDRWSPTNSGIESPTGSYARRPALSDISGPTPYFQEGFTRELSADQGHAAAIYTSTRGAHRAEHHSAVC